MIDVEKPIFTAIANAVHEQFPTLYIVGEEIRVPSTFPTVSVVEADNYTNTRTSDSGSNENHVNVMYEVNVFSNKKSGRKTQTKSILSVIDETFIKLGFVRTMSKPVTMDDATVYRMIARYTAVVSSDGKIYRR